jgi:hypothetical protein
LTSSGRKRFLEYLTTLEQVVRDAAAAVETKSPAALGKLEPARG